MKALLRPTVAFVVALVLVLALGGLVACGGTSSGSVDPKTVLGQASTSMKKIQGFHFVYEVHKPASAQPSAGLDIARIIGDVNALGNMQATIDVTQAGVPLQLKFVALGDTDYIQDPVSLKWQSMAAKDSPVGTLSLSAGTIQILDRITDTSYVGEETKGGVKTYHIAGKVAAAEVAAIAGAVNTTNTFPTDIWVGVSDSLVYEVDIAGAATPTEDPKIWRSIVLSNLDTFVDIKAPQ
jgi:hypothetical protein